VAFFQREERGIYLYSRGTGIPPRIIDPKCGEAVPLNGFVGPYGNTISLAPRGQEEWQRTEWTKPKGYTRGKIMSHLKRKYITIGYVSIMLTIGTVLQLWH